MTNREVADALNVSERTARRIIRESIPHLRVGQQQFRVARSDFDEYIRRCTTRTDEDQREPKQP